jgi:membrane protein DedA with SNARE-associated domain
VFDQFTQLVSDASGWAYAVIFIFALVDVVFPLVPSETAVITAGVVAASGDMLLVLVIAVAAVGAFAGDNLAYGIGRRFGTRATDRFFSGDKAKRRLDWSKRQMSERGGELIAAGRFIPGGRTAVTVTAGLTKFHWPRFARFDALAAVMWASYAAALGFVGGRVFEDKPWAGLLVAIGIALTVTLGIEVVRWVLGRRRKA